MRKAWQKCQVFFLCIKTLNEKYRPFFSHIVDIRLDFLLKRFVKKRGRKEHEERIKSITKNWYSNNS